MTFYDKEGLSSLTFIEENWQSIFIFTWHALYIIEFTFSLKSFNSILRNTAIVRNYKLTIGQERKSPKFWLCNRVRQQ